jgi:hypothetical protein
LKVLLPQEDKMDMYVLKFQSSYLFLDYN